jgi:hypothetical protein
MTEPEPLTPKRRRAPLILASTAALIVAAGVALFLFWPSSLDDRDPAGARACQILASWQRGEISENKLVVSQMIGDQAFRATTDSIRDTTGAAVMGLTLANPKRLHAVCGDEGVEMPPWVDAAW